MVKLSGNSIYLRALEHEDLDFLYQLENDTRFWEISNTITPYSKVTLRRYLESAHRDIYDVKQLRLCICSRDTHALIGFVDLFDFDPKNKRAGIGLVIQNEGNRLKGIGNEAVSLCCEYAFTALGLHQIYANVHEDNLPSVRLFEKLGFEQTGRKIDWTMVNGKFKNELLFQKLKENDKS